MGRTRPSLLVHTLACALVGAATYGAGCAQTVTVKVDGPHTGVRFGDTQLGLVPADGAKVEVAAGLDAVPYQVRRGDDVVSGSVPRTEPNPWLLATALGGVVCCVPGALVLGFCVANPGMLVAAPLALVGIGDLGAMTASCVAPSWATLPLLSGCGALGIAPSLLALVADAPPAEVVLRAPPTGTTPSADAPPGPVVGMAW